MSARTKTVIQTLLFLSISWIMFVAASLEAKPAHPSDKKKTVTELNQIIQSRNSDRTSKCHAVFKLFENYVQPKSANDFSGIFLDHSWIDEANIRVLREIGGLIPIDWGENETLYVIYLFPKNNGWSDWVVYLTLTGSQLGQQDLISLLKGHEPSAHGIQISEFALCDPQVHCRRFPPANAR